MLRWRALATSLALLLVALTGAAPSFGQFRQGATPPKSVASFSYVEQNLASAYQAVAVVTGSDRRYRGVGFAQCLRSVLAKVSGNPRLGSDPRIDRFAREANLFVASFDYVAAAITRAKPQSRPDTWPFAAEGSISHRNHEEAMTGKRGKIEVNWRYQRYAESHGKRGGREFKCSAPSNFTRLDVSDERVGRRGPAQKGG